MRIRCFACLAVFLMILVSCRQDVNRLSLAGEWNFALDPQDVGLQENGRKRFWMRPCSYPVRYRSKERAKMSV